MGQQRPADQVDAFREAIRPFLPTWRTLQIRGLADLENPRLLSAVASLTPEPPQPEETTEPIRGVVFIRTNIGLDRLDAFLDGWSAGVVELAGQVLSTEPLSPPRFWDLGDAQPDAIAGWPELAGYRHFRLQAHGTANLDSLLQPRDTWSVANALGFSQFDELSYRRLQFRVGGTYTTRMELGAPLLVQIAPSVAGRWLRLRARLPGTMSHDALSVVHRLQDARGHRLSAARIPVVAGRARGSGPMVTWEHAVPVPSGAIAGETHVFHAGFRSGAEPIASALVAVPRRGGRGAAARRAGGPWWAAVVGLLGNTRQWSKAGDPAEVVRPWLGLGAHTPQPALFERGIAVLLACCGLPQFEIGDAEGVDHVVFDDGPRPGVLLVSCTTSANIGEKIAPVGRQRAAVAQLVPDAAVEAAIAAPLDATVVRKLDADDCRNKGIRLLLRPEIEALFDVLRSGSPAEARASARRVVFGITVPDDLRA